MVGVIHWLFTDKIDYLVANSDRMPRTLTLVIGLKMDTLTRRIYEYIENNLANVDFQILAALDLDNSTDSCLIRQKIIQKLLMFHEGNEEFLDKALTHACVRKYLSASCLGRRLG